MKVQSRRNVTVRRVSEILESEELTRGWGGVCGVKFKGVGERDIFIEGK